MAKVKAIKEGGYYNHRRVKLGEVLEMKDVDKDGYYLDEKGKRKKFPKHDRKGNVLGEEERKCKWVGHVKVAAEKLQIDPKEVAAVLSGKNPGKGKDLSPEPEAKEEA